MKYDISENLQGIKSVAGALAADGDIVGTAFDSSDFDTGVMFELDIVLFTTGDFQLRIFKSVDLAFTVPVEITGGTQVVGSFANVLATAVTAEGDIFGKIGIIQDNDFPFLRATVTGTNTSVGTVVVRSTAMGEYVPVATA